MRLPAPMRAVLLSLAWLNLVLLICTPIQVVALERRHIDLFQYGSANAPETKEAFNNFKDLMSEKLPRLAAEILDNIRLSDAAKLALRPIVSGDGNELVRPVDRIPSLEAKRNHWRESGALAILTGRVKRLNNDNLSIRSTFFLGELGQPQGSETIDLELPFTAKTYDTTNDSHSTAVLYALAMEISGRCDLRADVFYLLSQAKLRADAIEAEAPDMGRKLTKVIKGALEEFSSRCVTG